MWCFISVFLWAFLGLYPAAAAEPAPTSPLSIQSKTMTIKNSENLVVFEGNVVMKRSDWTLTADRVLVFFVKSLESLAPSEGGDPAMNSGNVDTIDATGNVVIEQGERKAKSQRAIYHQKEEKIVLTGEPEAWEKDYVVKGSQMTIFLKENRSVVDKGHVVLP
jgi:lipopolysaccharide export system protein LptA